MYRRGGITRIGIAAALLGLAVLGCGIDKSRNPLSPSVAGPIAGVNISAPKPLEPRGGAEVRGDRQPVELLFESAVSNGERPIWHEVEVASDSSFASPLYRASKLMPGENGRTKHRLPDALLAGRSYYWRARALDGANTGPHSEVAQFQVMIPIVIGTPVPLSPIKGETTATNAPDFVVQNGVVSGPAGEVLYRFQVATDAALTNVVAVVTVPRSSGATTSMSLGSLPPGQQGFWRVIATNQVESSAWSQVESFRTPAAPAPTPGPGPSPGPAPPPGPVGPARTISPTEVLSIVRNVHDTLGYNLGSGSTREQRIQFLWTAVATVHYGHSRFNPQGPDSDWCVKDAGSGRPPSDDVIVSCRTRDAWDIIGGAGANGYSFHLDYIGRLPGDQNVYPPPRSSLP